jgi:hypothetical protein
MTRLNCPVCPDNPENKNTVIVDCIMMQEPIDKKKKRLKEKLTEDRIILQQEEKEKARKRTRGPYRKSSSVRM